jgi:4'-phosphopantetheinyl transferase
MEWFSPPHSPTLAEQEVHLWRVDLDANQDYSRLAQLLSPDETERAERFRFETLRQRFIVGRGALRSLLGHYLNLAPRSLQFSYGTYGKPELADDSNPLKLRFNVTHSSGLALYGVTCDRAIGIDLEYIRPVNDLMQLTRRFFSAQEHAAISALPPAEQQTAFFRHWVCKEAYLKATGEGISQLAQAEISFVSGQPVLSAIAPSSQPQWSLLEFIPVDNAIAALAVAGQPQQIKSWQFVPPDD